MKFAKESRVNVPGSGGAQGVIVDVIETVPGFPVYSLNWLTTGGEKMLGSCGEGDLVRANPPTISLVIDPTRSVPEMVATVENALRGTGRQTVKQMARSLQKPTKRKR